MAQRMVTVNGHRMTYKQYLESDEWREQRRQAYVRATGHCQLCGKWMHFHSGFHCHHNSYENIGAELPHQLTILCRKCHDGFHRKWKPKKQKKRVQMLTASESKRRGGKRFVMVNK